MSVKTAIELLQVIKQYRESYPSEPSEANLIEWRQQYLAALGMDLPAAFAIIQSEYPPVCTRCGNCCRPPVVACEYLTTVNDLATCTCDPKPEACVDYYCSDAIQRNVPEDLRWL